MASLFLNGCYTTKSTPLPEPAVTQGLAGAETKLDTLTDTRISRTAASIVVARETAESLPQSPESSVVKGELDVAKSMVGEPTKPDLDYARARASLVMKADPNSKASYEKSVANAISLKQMISDANSKYETEKAKKQAEFESKLREKEIEISRQKMELEQASVAKMSERWGMIGTGMFAIGLILVALSPLASLKRLGFFFIAGGLVAGSVPFISNESWFKYAIGGTIGLVVLTVIVYSIWSNKNKSKCEVDKSNNDINLNVESEFKSNDSSANPPN